MLLCQLVNGPTNTGLDSALEIAVIVDLGNPNRLAMQF